VGSYANYGPKRYDNFEDEATVGVNLEFHLFDGLQTRHAIGRAERDAAIAHIRYESALREKSARAQDLLRELETAGRRAELGERRADTAREQQRLADLALRAGRGSLDQALGARERVVQLDRDAADGRFHQLEVWARLQRELGSLAQALGAAPAP
jgi:outer membrane protein TolC